MGCVAFSEWGVSDCRQRLSPGAQTSGGGGSGRPLLQGVLLRVLPVGSPQHVRHELVARHPRQVATIRSSNILPVIIKNIARRILSIGLGDDSNRRIFKASKAVYTQ